VPDNIKENLDIRPVKWIDEVLAIALERMPEPMTDEAYMDGVLSITNGDDAQSDSGDVNRPRSH